MVYETDSVSSGFFCFLMRFERRRSDCRRSRDGIYEDEVSDIDPTDLLI
jgi:hypothetical protein